MNFIDDVNPSVFYEKKKDIINFLLSIKDGYNPKAFFYLLLMLESEDFLYDESLLNCNLSAILSKFDVLRNEKDMYKLFAQMLQKYSLLEGNCCEVAAGCYPRLSEIIYPLVDNKKSKLTIYDPKLVIQKLGNAKLYREEFSLKTDISDIDTMIGLYPCDATIPLVEKALYENKNLMVACCSCDHSTLEYPLWVGNYWAEDFCMNLKEEYGNEIKILNWPKYMKNPLPIILRKKRTV